MMLKVLTAVITTAIRMMIVILGRVTEREPIISGKETERVIVTKEIARVV
jgi:hypothetical protein